VKPVKAGYLQYFSKRSGLNKSKGKKRYVHLTRDSLTLHASDKMDEKPFYQVIDLQHEVKEIKTIKDAKSPNCFSMRTTVYKEKEFFFLCENVQEMMSWVLYLSALQSLNVNKSLLDPKDKV
jgi:hypothetical protein